MAQKIHVELVDDLDGSPAVETVQFAIRGRTYEVDLNKKNVERLNKALTPFMENGRYVRPSGRPAKKGASNNAQAVREWAKQNGFEVSARGAIPQNVREAYSAANS